MAATSAGTRLSELEAGLTPERAIRHLARDAHILPEAAQPCTFLTITGRSYEFGLGCCAARACPNPPSPFPHGGRGSQSGAA